MDLQAADLVIPDDPAHPRLDSDADPDLPFVSAAADYDGEPPEVAVVG